MSSSIEFTKRDGDLSMVIFEVTVDSASPGVLLQMVPLAKQDVQPGQSGWQDLQRGHPLGQRISDTKTIYAALQNRGANRDSMGGFLGYC